MNTFLRIALIALVFTSLAACGAKGPLVLPEKAEPVEVPAGGVEVDADAGAIPEDAEGQAEDAVDTPATTPAGNG